MPKRTPFYDLHKTLDAKLIDFGGFEMPVQYSGVKEEHLAVRERVGIFDVSHMGEFFVSGPQALELIQQVTVNDASKLEPGKAQYSVMCYEDGGIVDDLIVYQLGDNSYMLVVNAANIDKDYEWIVQHNKFEAEVDNRSETMCLLAVQGPDSVNTLQQLTEEDLSKIGFYHFKRGALAGYDMIISATGYTGEKGFELYFDGQTSDPQQIWKAIMDTGAEYNIQLCGLAARDTLRLEMGYALYGNDISRDTHPLEAGLGWLVKFQKGAFTGRDALLQLKENGYERKLVGFMAEERRSIPRAGYPLLNEAGNTIGEVTSGSMSISLNKGVGMGYVEREYAAEGTGIFTKIRNKKAGLEVKKPPFINK